MLKLTQNPTESTSSLRAVRLLPQGLWRVLQPLSLSSLLTILSLYSGLSLGNVIADGGAPGAHQPQILNTSSGITQVNITTPSTAGVSRNQYQQFDVPVEGIILNNSRTSTTTQLGGYVEGNASLARGTARVILNEVTGSNAHASQLGGYIEVVGSTAQVIVANPNGIACNGCGFINASRGTLTTGVAELTSGAITGYVVNGGVISIGGSGTNSGLDASGTRYADVIAGAVEVGAGVWANELNVIAGVNHVSTQTVAGTTPSRTNQNGLLSDEGVRITGVRAIAATTPPTTPPSNPTIAIDVSELGGMYAGKINLIATRDGVGVRNAGELERAGIPRNQWNGSDITKDAAAMKRLDYQLNNNPLPNPNVGSPSSPVQSGGAKK